MRHVIVGASVAGLAAADALQNQDPGAELTLLSEEKDPPYCRPLLSYWLAGETPESLFPLPLPRRSSLDLRLGCRVAALRPAEKRVVLASGEYLSYDRLLLATGAAAARMGIEGEAMPNVWGLRVRDDARAIDAEIRRGAQKAVVLGGGLVGLKTAHALAARGVRTILAVASGHPLSQVVDRTAGELVAEALREQGLDVRTGIRPTGVRDAGGRAAAVRFSDGSQEPCDLVVVGKGVTPRTELAQGHGFDAGQGIPVDPRLRTPLSDVWAAGDVALAFDAVWQKPRLNAIWPAAAEQGALAGRNMAGAEETYGGSVAMNSVRVGDLHLISAGVTRPPDGSYRERSALDRGSRFYRKIVVRDGRLVGMIAVGAPEQAGLVVAAIRRGSKADDLPFDPLDPGIHWGRYAFSSETPGGGEAVPAGG